MTRQLSADEQIWLASGSSADWCDAAVIAALGDIARVRMTQLSRDTDWVERVCIKRYRLWKSEFSTVLKVLNALKIQLHECWVTKYLQD
jgi:DNA-binding phage protein